MEKITIMVVDDDVKTRQAISEILHENGYQVAAFGNGSELLETIKGLKDDNNRFLPTAILVDLDMPVMNGVETLIHIAQMKEENPDMFCLPFPMSGKKKTSLDRAITLEAGGGFFLEKPIRVKELLAVAESAQRALNKAVERREALLRDDLTGFYRKKHGLERLDEEISRASRSGRPVGFLFIDLDDFKSINDSHGHLVGDELLRLISYRITESKRSYDVGIRYGGDEFALILPDTDLEQSEKEARRIWKNVSKNPFLIQGKVISMTVSIGVAMGAGLNGRELLAQADNALLRAKKEGRDRVCVFSNSPEEVANTFPFPKSGTPPA